MGVSKSLFISPSSVLCAQFLSLEALPPILLLSVSLSFFPLLRSQPEPTEICGLPGRHHRERIEYVTCESAWLSDRPAGRGKPSQRCSRSGALPLFLAPCDGGRSPSLSLPCRCAAPPPSTSSPSPSPLSLSSALSALLWRRRRRHCRSFSLIAQKQKGEDFNSAPPIG